MSGGEIAIWGLLVSATVTDLLWGKVYNALTFPALFLGICFRFYEFGPEGASHAMMGVTAAFILFFPLYLIRTFAAGDVKLLMAVGAWAEVDLVIRMGMLAILIGAGVGFFLMLKKRGVKDSARSLKEHLRVQRMDVSESYRMPLAPAFLCALFFSQIAEINQWPFLS